MEGRSDYTRVIGEQTPTAQREYINIYFRSHGSSTLFKKVGDDLLTYLGDLGGLFDALHVMGTILTAGLASKLLNSAMIEKAYKI